MKRSVTNEDNLGAQADKLHEFVKRSVTNEDKLHD